MKTELILLGSDCKSVANDDTIVYDYTKPNMSAYGCMISLILHLHRNAINDNTIVQCQIPQRDDVCLFYDDDVKTMNDFNKSSAYNTYIKYFKLHVYNNENTITDYNNFYLQAIEAICKSNNLTLTFLT